MARHVRIGLFTAVWLGLAAAPAAEQKRYLLSKVPTFRVGDRVVVDSTGDAKTMTGLADGTVAEKSTERKESRCIHEVLEVDAAGRVQAFRVTIVSEKVKVAVTLPESRAGKKEVALGKIHFIARRKGSRFTPDPTSVVGESARKLKASELSVLRKHFDIDIDLAGCPELEAGLMPAQPVPVGHRWEPSRQALDRYARDHEEVKRMGGKLLGAQLTFISATEGIARVQVVLRVEVTLFGKTHVITPSTIAKIDTKTGLWISETSSVSLSLKRPGFVVDSTEQREQIYTFTRGAGKASALPAQCADLGWKPPGRDTNNYKDPRMGFSLTVPEGFNAVDAPRGPRVVAKFASASGLGLTVTYVDLGRFADFEDFLPSVIQGIKGSLGDYEVGRREQLALPGNVPAILLVGKAHQGKVILYTLAALDGGRVTTVSAAAPAEKPDLQAKMLAAVKSLRVFQPDLTKTPKAP